MRGTIGSARHIPLFSKEKRVVKCFIRPLVLGSRERNGKTEYCVASEDCAFGPIGFQRVRDVAPGEMLIVTGRPLLCLAAVSADESLVEGVVRCRLSSAWRSITCKRISRPAVPGQSGTKVFGQDVPGRAESCTDNSAYRA